MNRNKKEKGIDVRYKKSKLSPILKALVKLSAFLTVGVLLSLIAYILIMGIPNITPELFAWEYTSDNGSVTPALISTLIIVVLTLIIAVPIGIFSAIYLVEYAKKGNKLVKIVRVTTETLSGIPSIVYGLFGAIFFNIYLGFGYSILGGSLTLAIMVLPLIMRTTEEALLSVSDSFREGSFGLGAGKLRTVFKIVLPAAMPGILAGVILAIGRIVGETAALIYTAGTVTRIPTSIMDSGRTLSVHLWQLLSEGLEMEKGYATAVILLVLVILINSMSALVARKFVKKGDNK